MDRWRLSESRNESRIEITAKNNAVFWTMWLIFATVFVVVSVYTFLSFKEQVLILLLIWGIAILVFGILGIHGLIWSLTGKEILKLTPNELTYERVSWKVDNQHVRISLSDILSIEVLSLATGDMLRDRRIRLRLKNGYLKFGSDLSKVEASDLVGVLNSRITIPH
jgi:hypothetical protein